MGTLGPNNFLQLKPQSSNSSPEVTALPSADRAEETAPSAEPPEQRPISSQSSADSAERCPEQKPSRLESSPQSPEKPPTSESQRQARQRNSHKSTGPKTEAGKRRSSRNAVKHGILASGIVNPDLGERWEDYEALWNEHREIWQPAGLRDEEDVKGIVDTSWYLRRVRRATNGEIAKAMNTDFWDALWDKRREKFERDRLEWQLMRAQRKVKPEEGEKSAVERVRDADKIVRNLKTTIGGIDFVSLTVRVVRKEIEETRILSTEDHMLLVDCFGIDAIDLPVTSTDDETSEAEAWEDEESQEEESQTEKESQEKEELRKRKLELILAYIDDQLSSLEAQRECVEMANEREFRATRESLCLPPLGASVNLLRYETYLEKKKAHHIAALEHRQMLRKAGHVA